MYIFPYAEAHHEGFYGVKVKSPGLKTSALDEDEWSTSRSDHFTHKIRDWVGL
jgi:hypothetical protein